MPVRLRRTCMPTRTHLCSDKTPAELIRAVCSPGGTTIEGMKVLEDRDLYGIVSEACDKCIKRAYELG